MFIFDVFDFAESMAILQVPREEQFSPVKNAEAPGKRFPCNRQANALRLAQDVAGGSWRNNRRRRLSWSVTICRTMERAWKFQWKDCKDSMFDWKEKSDRPKHVLCGLFCLEDNLVQETNAFVFVILRLWYGACVLLICKKKDFFKTKRRYDNLSDPVSACFSPKYHMIISFLSRDNIKSILVPGAFCYLEIWKRS